MAVARHRELDALAEEAGLTEEDRRLSLLELVRNLVLLLLDLELVLAEQLDLAHSPGTCVRILHRD